MSSDRAIAMHPLLRRKKTKELNKMQVYNDTVETGKFEPMKSDKSSSPKAFKKHRGRQPDFDYNSDEKGLDDHKTCFWVTD